MSHYSFIVQSKSVNDRKQTRVKPCSLLLFCFSVSFFILMCSTLARGLRRRREYLKCAPWEIWQNKAAAAILANAVLHTKTMLTIWTMLTFGQTVNNWCQTFDNPCVWTGVLHITTMLPICALIIMKRQRQHYRKHYKETVAAWWWRRWDSWKITRICWLSYICASFHQTHEGLKVKKGEDGDWFINHKNPETVILSVL